MESDVCKGVENCPAPVAYINVFLLPYRRFTNPRVEHGVPIIRTSGDQRLRKGQLLAVHPGPHLGHHHRDELPGGPAGSGVRGPPPLLHLLLQRPVFTLFHHPRKLQLWTVRRPQAQGETEPTALLHGGVSRSCSTSLCGKKKKYIFVVPSFPPSSLVSSHLPGGEHPWTRKTTQPELSSVGIGGTVQCW